MSEVIERIEILRAEPARALGALLDVPVPDLDQGAGLPLLWHWVYLLDRPAQADLGPDGHAVRGTVPVPPGPGLRRMAAGGRVRTSGLLRCGAPATRRSSVLSVTGKQGRSGHLTFVVVGHQITQDGRVVVDEEQDIVYREAVSSGAGPTGAGPTGAGPTGAGPTGAGPTGAGRGDAGGEPVVPPGDGERSIEVSPALLFRFSALIYNAHRIHYDREYTRDVEGYPGLLTHGPLQALAMAEAARAAAAGAGTAGNARFEYQVTAPLFDYQGLVVSAVPANGVTVTSVRDIHGRRTASGTLRSG